MQQVIIASIILSLTAFVWTRVLVKDLFDFVPKLYYAKVGHNYPKLENIIFGCAKCVGGQLAFWSGFYFWWGDPLSHFITIILTIFIAYILEKYV